MKRTFLGVLIVLIVRISSFSQPVPVPTGNPADFKVKTCLHSIGYAGLWGQDKLTVDEFLLKAKELGYDGVILTAKRPHVSPLDYNKEARAELKKKIKDLGLTLVGLAGYTDFTAGIDKKGPGVPQTEIQAAYIGMVAELANDLGTKMVRIYTGIKRPTVPYDEQYATVVEGITLAAKEAQKYGVTLFVQNHNDIAFNYNDMYHLLNEDINLPNVKAGWDPRPGLSPEETKQSVLKMKPFIVNTISDARVLSTDVVAIPKGKGKLDYKTDYKTFYGTLKEIGYQGYLTFEMCSPMEGGGSMKNLDASAIKFLNYVKQFK